MKNDEKIICCIGCPMMKMTRRADVTFSNIGKTPRGYCFCQHPDAERLFKEHNRKSLNKPGFIAFTKPGSNQPDMKTAPRWCPRKLMGDNRTMQPKQITRKEAYVIIGTRKPLGRFYLPEGNGYTGIDNMTGEAWVEEFPSMPDCLNWLNRFKTDG